NRVIKTPIQRVITASLEPCRLTKGQPQCRTRSSDCGAFRDVGSRSDGMDSSRFFRGIIAVNSWVGPRNQEEATMDATSVAVDLAKDVFEIAVANRAGRIIERKRLTRRQFERFVDTLPAGVEVIMEGCGTAHYWGRRCRARDVSVRLLPVQYVRPYVRRNKTDRTDTEALLEANRCGGIQPVAVKTVEQQAIQALHRVRTQWQA